MLPSYHSMSHRWEHELQQCLEADTDFVVGQFVKEHVDIPARNIRRRHAELRRAAEGAAKSCDLWVRAIVLSMPLPNKLTVAEAFVLLWQDPETGDICDKKFDAGVQSIPVAAMLVDLVLMGKLTPEFGSKNRMFSTKEQALVCTGDVSDSLHPATTFLQSLFLEAVLFFKMIIAFLIDTSVSMNHKAETGMTLLDIAKCGFEHFVRVRQTTPDGRDNKYCLITSDPGPHTLKVGPKESQSLIKNALKCLVAHSTTALGESLNMLFSVLNQGHLLSEEVSGIDRHGFGWYATNTEPAVIILPTDGGLPTSDRGVTDSNSSPRASLSSARPICCCFCSSHRVRAHVCVLTNSR